MNNTNGNINNLNWGILRKSRIFNEIEHFQVNCGMNRVREILELARILKGHVFLQNFGKIEPSEPWDSWLSSICRGIDPKKIYYRLISDNWTYLCTIYHYIPFRSESDNELSNKHDCSLRNEYNNDSRTCSSWRRYLSASNSFAAWVNLYESMRYCSALSITSCDNFSLINHSDLYVRSHSIKSKK